MAVLALATTKVTSTAQTSTRWGSPSDVLIEYAHLPDDSLTPHGSFRAKHAGVLWLEGTFDRGVKTGEWSTYHLETGATLSSGQFVGGQPDGPWTFRHPDGRLAAYAHFERGMPIGTWTSYYAGLFEEPRLHAQWTDDALFVLNLQGDTLLSRRLVEPGFMKERKFDARGRLEVTGTYKWPASTDPRAMTSRELLLEPHAKSGLTADQPGWVAWGSIRRFSTFGAMMEHVVLHGDTLLQLVGLTDVYGNPRAGDGVWNWRPLTGSGLIPQHSPAGDLLRLDPIQNNLPHGATTFYHAHGTVRARGEYAAGLPVGRWEIFETTGRLAYRLERPEPSDCWSVEEVSLSGVVVERFTLCDGLPDGPWVEFDVYGDTAQVTTWARGVLEGPVRKFRRSALFQTGQHSGHARTGTWTSFNPRGIVVFESVYTPPRRTNIAMLAPADLIEKSPERSGASSAFLAGGFDADAGLGEGWGWLAPGAHHGAAGFALRNDVSGHVLSFECLFADSEEARARGALALQRVLVLRPVEVWGLPRAGERRMVLDVLGLD
jgi:antitoxin component YwqK of YwqJK toxin-antitoxin module